MRSTRCREEAPVVEKLNGRPPGASTSRKQAALTFSPQKLKISPQNRFLGRLKGSGQRNLCRMRSTRCREEAPVVEKLNGRPPGASTSRKQAALTFSPQKLKISPQNRFLGRLKGSGQRNLCRMRSTRCREEAPVVEKLNGRPPGASTSRKQAALTFSPQKLKISPQNRFLGRLKGSGQRNLCRMRSTRCREEAPVVEKLNGRPPGASTSRKQAALTFSPQKLKISPQNRFLGRLKGSGQRNLCRMRSTRCRKRPQS
jgi:hypothetical protein